MIDEQALVAAQHATRTAGQRGHLQSAPVPMEVLRAAITAYLSASAEPVAWRWREKGHVAWKCGTYLPVKPHDHWDIEPLYTHPEPPMSDITEEEIARAPVYDGSIEVRLDDKGGVDEIVGLGVICHIERLSNGTWFVSLTRPDQTEEAFWLAGKGSVEVCHTEHRTAPATGPNAAPWTLAAAIRKG